MCVKNDKKNININKFKDINNIINNINLFEDSFNNKNNTNQLFSKINPPFDLVKEIIYILINKQLNNDIYYEFTIKNLINKKILEIFIIFIPELKKYYLKCKHNKYLENLNEKKLITILRQILRPYDYYINSIEKYNNGEKFLLYILEKNKTSGLKKISSLITFD
jgi:hypothetical protein